MPIYWDTDKIVAETGGEINVSSHEYAKYFSKLYKKTGKVFKISKSVQLTKEGHKIL